MEEHPYADWIEALERPHWDSLCQVYKRAHLSPEEAAALDEYRNITEYYLLRAKVPMVAGIQGPSLIRRLGGYLRYFNSDSVRGIDCNEPPRRSFMNEMFGDPKIHKVTQRRLSRRLPSGEIQSGVGNRSRAWSTIFWDKLAELQVLTFFCANGYDVILPRREGGPKPEFFIELGGITLGVEVKNLDVDAVLDRIFGDFDSETNSMREVGPEGQSERLAPEDYRGIVGTIERQYCKAVRKFTKALGVVFIFVPMHRSQIEKYLHDFREQLSSTWQEGDDPTVIGVAFVFYDCVDFLRNQEQRRVTDQLRFEYVDLDDLPLIYEKCAVGDHWPD